MTAAAVPVLRRPEHQVDQRAVRYWTVRALTGWLAVAAVQILWLVLDGGAGAGAHAAGLAVTAVAGTLHTLVMPRWRYRVHRWEMAPEALYTQTGWLVEERRIAPVSRIQTVDTRRGPLEQTFGLMNVTVTTASAAGPLVIQGLEHETALRIVAELTERARVTEGDAT
ncbi:PH domain-containing protein [Streptomyces sp. NPDC013178]|uniref:PH domain-containing protein n=1 Tax=Streptomyces sp. NPDC013178 TaxID=3155118 RepID=UPI00340797ED